jgi:excinuclease ABC subunit C
VKLPTDRVQPHLRELVRDRAENRPGVYAFVGPREEILYVGKSVRIRARLLSYFRRPLPSKESELIRTARDVRWDYTPNEFEALLLELRMIRRLRPRFNTRHRRERRFAWIRLTSGPAPRLAAARAPRPDGSRYFGPIPAGRELPRSLRDLAHAIGLRDCPDSTPIHFADQLDILSPARAPACLRGETGSCPAPCAGRVSVDGYRARVETAVAFLEGRSEEPLRRLGARLEAAAGNREYELAARLRDRIQRITDVQSRILTFSQELGRLDLVYRPPATDGTERSYLIVAGRVRLVWNDDGRVLRVGGGFGVDRREVGAGHRKALKEDRAGLRDQIRRLAMEPGPVPATLSAGEREELFLVIRWFRQNPEEFEHTRSIQTAAGDPTATRY